MTKTMTSANLILAITLLSARGISVISIQFEDGSGTKFNYMPYGTNRWVFVDLKKDFDSINQRVEYNEMADNIIAKF
jgi:hypothetical protein